MAAIQAIGTGPVALTSENGAHLTIPLSALTIDNGVVKVSGGRSCLFDLRVRFDDGYEQTFSDVNLCKVARVVAS